jgi:hypothetical protein
MLTCCLTRSQHQVESSCSYLVVVLASVLVDCCLPLSYHVFCSPCSRSFSAFVFSYRCSNGPDLASFFSHYVDGVCLAPAGPGIEGSFGGQGTRCVWSFLHGKPDEQSSQMVLEAQTRPKCFYPTEFQTLEPSTSAHPHGLLISLSSEAGVGILLVMQQLAPNGMKTEPYITVVAAPSLATLAWWIPTTEQGYIFWMSGMIWCSHRLVSQPPPTFTAPSWWQRRAYLAKSNSLVSWTSCRILSPSSFLMGSK